MDSNKKDCIQVKELVKDAEIRNKVYQEYIDGGLTHDEEFLNNLKPSRCPYCGQSKFHLDSQNKRGINLYKCDYCNGKFTLLTNTVFDGMNYPIHDWHCFLASLFQKHFMLQTNLDIFPKEDHEKFIALAKILTRVNGSVHLFQNPEVEIHLFSYPDKKGKIDKPRLIKPSDYQNYVLAFVSDGIRLKTAIVGAGFCNPQTINNYFKNAIKPGTTLVTKPFNCFETIIEENNLKSKIVLASDDDLRKNYEIYRGVKLEDEFDKFIKTYKVKGMNLLLEYYLKVFELIERNACPINRKISFVIGLLLNNYLVSEYEQYLIFKKYIQEQFEW